MFFLVSFVFSEPYQVILNPSCPRISSDCLFSLTNTIDESIALVEHQCTLSCATQFDNAIKCNSKDIGELLSRIYNAKCAQINGNLCWVEYLTNLKKQYSLVNDTINGNFTIDCSDCNQKLFQYEDSLARHLETEFGTNRRQVLFMKYHRESIDTDCRAGYIEYGQDAAETQLEGFGSIIKSSTAFPIWAYFIIAFGILFLFISMWLLIQRSKRKRKTDEKTDSVMEDVSDDTTHDYRPKLEDLHVTPNINRLSQYSIMSSPISPVSYENFQHDITLPNRFSVYE